MASSSAPRTALFVIDIQNDLATDPATRIPHADRIRAAGHKILEAARAVVDSSSPSSPLETTPSPIIVFVQHEEAPDQGPMVRGSEAWKLVFEPREGHEEGEMLVAKTTRDTFASNPTLAARLKSAGVSRVVAFGIQSEVCVLSTCQGALAAGFEVVVLRGAHSTYNDRERGTAVEIGREAEDTLAGLGAVVEPWEDAVERWGVEGRLS